MANDLQTKLDAILLDKNTNLLPENLKKGVTLLGVEGNLEAGGSAEVPVKLFNSEEELQADPTKEIGDLAVTYYKSLQNVTADTRFSVAKCPTTVVLPNAFGEDYVNIMYAATDSSIPFNCWGDLSADYFMMSCYSNDTEIRIEYESSDGITYTRTDGGDELVDFGTEIYYSRPEYWNDVIGYFIQASSQYFGGFYEYNTRKDTNKAAWITNMRVVDGEGVYDLDKENGLKVDEVSSICNEIISHFNLDLTKSSQYISFVKSGETLTAYVGLLTTTTSEPYQYATSLSLVQDTSNNWGVGTYSTELVDGVYKITIGDNLSYTKLPTGTKIPVGTYTWGHWKYGSISTSDKYTTLEISENGNIDVNSEIAIYGYNVGYDYSRDNYGTTTKYYHAPSQLTLSDANQLLTGVVGYGKNGAVTGDGSIYDNLVWTNDVLGKCPTEVYCDYMGILSDATSKTDRLYDYDLDVTKNKVYGIVQGDKLLSFKTQLTIDTLKKYITFDKTYTSLVIQGISTGNNKLCWLVNASGAYSGSNIDVLIITYDGITKTFDYFIAVENTTGQGRYLMKDVYNGDLYICIGSMADNYYMKNTTVLSASKINFEERNITNIIDTTYSALDSDISSYIASSSGMFIYNGYIYVNYLRRSDTDNYSVKYRLRKLANGVNKMIENISSTYEYYPHHVHYLDSTRGCFVDDKFYFVRFNDTKNSLAYLDLNTDTVTDLTTVTVSSGYKERNYWGHCTYKLDNCIYWCIYHSTVNGSSGGTYGFDVFKYNLTTNTNIKIFNTSYDRVKADTGHRLIFNENKGKLYLRYNSVIEIDPDTDTVTEITTVPRSEASGPLYRYIEDGISITCSRTELFVDTGNADLSAGIDTKINVIPINGTVGKFVICDYKGYIKNSVTQEEYEQAQEQINDLFGEEETE